MKKNTRNICIVAIGFFLIAIAMPAFSQEDVIEQQEVGQQELDQITGIFDADFQEVSIDLFEDPTLWAAYISGDFGYTTHQRFEGGPSAKVSLDNVQLGDSVDENVLGVKTEFIKRGFTEIVFRPLRPIPVPGQVTNVALWVAGRNLPHELCIRMRDVNLKMREACAFRKLNFLGWQRIDIQIPPYVELSDELYTGVQQYDPRRPLDSGIEIVSIVIKPLFTEAYGTYYIYFDDMRATTDLSVITSRDPDDIVDAW